MHAFDRMFDFVQPDPPDPEEFELEEDYDREWDRTHDDIDWTRND